VTESAFDEMMSNIGENAQWIREGILSYGPWLRDEAVSAGKRVMGLARYSSIDFNDRVIEKALPELVYEFLDVELGWIVRWIPGFGEGVGRFGSNLLDGMATGSYLLSQLPQERYFYRFLGRVGGSLFGLPGEVRNAKKSLVWALLLVLCVALMWIGWLLLAQPPPASMRLRKLRFRTISEPVRRRAEGIFAANNPAFRVAPYGMANPLPNRAPDDESSQEFRAWCESVFASGRSGVHDVFKALALDFYDTTGSGTIGSQLYEAFQQQVRPAAGAGGAVNDDFLALATMSARALLLSYADHEVSIDAIRLLKEAIALRHPKMLSGRSFGPKGFVTVGGKPYSLELIFKHIRSNPPASAMLVAGLEMRGKMSALDPERNLALWLNSKFGEQVYEVGLMENAQVIACIINLGFPMGN
jgi:hypothetical protein